jgi:hypothetical protein
MGLVHDLNGVRDLVKPAGAGFFLAKIAAYGLQFVPKAESNTRMSLTPVTPSKSASTVQFEMQPNSDSRSSKSEVPINPSSLKSPTQYTHPSIVQPQA